MERLPVAIIVDADVAELRTTERAMEAAGFVVMRAESFERARILLESTSPGIVIADIKLGAFNGLHLAALCAAAHPDLPFIATHGAYDPVLAADAAHLGATYVVKTRTREELTQLARKLLFSGESAVEARRWPRKAVPTATLARVDASEATILDVSYGGVRLRLRQAPALEDEPPASFEIELPQLPLSLHASRKWATRDPSSAGWLCGADLSQSGSNELGRWRNFVDSIN